MPTLHTKWCFSRALICAIENWRDDDTISRADFVSNIRLGLVEQADDYYDGLIECTCPPVTNLVAVFSPVK